MSRRLRLANEQIQALAALDVYGRVARQLLAFAQVYGAPVAGGDVVIPLRLTQTDLADLVGASRVRVNQVLVAFRESRHISVDQQQRITIHHPEALAEFCA
jgi:CRP/FNR family cyclic AMP-dependent transcriptional regulator